MNRKSQPALEIILEYHHFIGMRRWEGLTEGRPPSGGDSVRKNAHLHHPVISASSILDGTHSSSWLASTTTFFGFTAPFFSAISQIWFGIGGGCACGCESGSARAEEEDEVAKWQRWERGVRRYSYKALPHLSHSRVFGKPLHDLRLSAFSEIVWWAITWAFAQL